MKLAIMQPYFFPYLGYFALIARTDAWVVFDVAQYTPKSWMNRNRVLHPTRGWMYITLPVRNGSRSRAIHEVRALDPHRARASIQGKLSHYSHRAPFYAEVTGVVDAAFASAADETLVRINVAALEAVCRYVGLRFDHSVCSGLDLNLEVDGPGGWAPAIAEAVGADSYVNPAGGHGLFDPAEFRRRGIELSFLEMPNFVYDTKPYRYEPSLSVLDALMWNSPQRVLEALNSASLVTPSAVRT